MRRREDEKAGRRAGRRVFALVVLGALAVAASGASAQRGGANPNRLPPVPGQGRVLQPEQRLGQVMQRQLQLSDAQVPRLQELTRRFNERRRVLLEEERSVRMQMREVLCGTDTTRGADVSRWIDQLFELERRRLDLRLEEQRDLAAFLTPYQRARYLGTAEQVGRRLEEQLGQGRGQGVRGGARGAQQGGGAGGGRQGGPPPEGPPRDGRGGPAPMLDACGNPLSMDGRAMRGRGRGGDGAAAPSPFVRN